MFRLVDSSAESLEAARRFKEALEALPAVIPVLRSIEVGINENPAEKWHLALTATVDTMADVAVYANHPAHVAAAAIIAPVKADRACVDYSC